MFFFRQDLPPHLKKVLRSDDKLLEIGQGPTDTTDIILLRRLAMCRECELVENQLSFLFHLFFFGGLLERKVDTCVFFGGKVFLLASGP